MNCAECERLFDAYLDGELSGSLLLELDAHRLQCWRCQQTLAMMEVCEHVVNVDREMPTLSADFTERVMRQVTGERETTMRRRRVIRALWTTGIAVQAAAAVLVLALFLPGRAGNPSGPQEIAAVTEPEKPLAALAEMDEIDVYEYIMDRVDERLAMLQSAQANFTADLGQLARYPLSVTVPRDVARASAAVATVNPIGGFLQTLFPAEGQEGESTGPVVEQYSL